MMPNDKTGYGFISCDKITNRLHFCVLAVKTSFWFVFGALFFLFFTLNTAFAVSDKPSVLYISSYHPGFPTFFQQVDGIKKVFRDQVLLEIEFMDTKRFPEKETWEHFEKTLSYKLEKNNPYSLIIVADDNALVFALGQQDSLFKDIPVVFLGVNNIDRALAQDGNPQFTGVIEAVSMDETLDLMIRFNPRARRIIALVDNTPSGQADLKSFYKSAEKFSAHEFSDLSLAKMDWEGFLKTLGTLDEENSILLLSAYKDRKNKNYLFSESLALIRKELRIPLFHLWRHGLGEGIIGGKVISHFEQGRVAAEIALSILNGTPVENIPVSRKSPNRYIFDYYELRQFNIPEYLVPDSALIVNQSNSFYSENKTLIWSYAAILLVLSLALILAVINILTRKKMAAELKNREIRQRTIIETIPDLMWLKDPDGVYLTCNLKFEQFFGAKEEEIVGKTDFDFVDNELAEFFRQKDNAAFHAGKPVMNEEEVIFASDGLARSLETIKAPMYDSAGNAAGVLGIARDITWRKEAEKSLRKSEKRFALAMEHSRDGLFDWTLHDNTTYYSPGWKRMLGYGEHELSNDFSVWENLTDPDDVKRVREVVNRLINRDIERLDVEFKMKHKDGHWVDINAKANAVFDDEGKVVRIIGTHTDITEQKKAAMALKASEEKFAMAFNRAPILMTISSLDDGRYVEVNETFTRVTGYTRDVAVGSTSVELGFIPAAARDKLKAEILLNGYIHELELELKKAGGEKLFCLYSGRIIRIGGKEKLLSLALDITERKSMENRLLQAQKMESIGNLAGGIAHDFNNLLSPIIGMSELVIDDLPEDSPLLENVHEILKAGIRGSELVKQILTFSRQADQKKVPVKIQQIIGDVFKLLRATIPSNIEIKSRISQNCGMVNANPTQIHQVAMNLITNAYHAVEEKGGMINILLDEKVCSEADLINTSLAPDNYIVLSVSDNGSGMNPDILGKVFEPYFTTKEPGKGTGLGLAVVFGIVKEHHGDVKMESEAGQGTTVSIYFPLLKDTEHPVFTIPNEVSVTGTERILLVDDEVAVTRLLKRLLERLGYTITVYNDSIAALEAFKASPGAYDLVISDMTMPGMTGDLLTDAMLSIRPDVPIIICTGYSERMNSQKAETMGAKGYLMKPVNKSGIGLMVRNVLDDARQGRSR